MTHKLGVVSVMFVLATALFGAGCAKGVNFSANSPGGNSSSGSVTNQVPACEIDMSQLELVANVDSFEFEDSFGVTFGYNQNGAAGGAGGSASVKVSTASMSLSMEGLNPLNLAQLVGDTVSANQTSMNLNATIDFSQFSVSPNYYSSTPLAQVSLNGLTLGVQGIKSQYDAVSWIGRVVQQINSNTVMINGGFVTGVQVGDTFNIYNVQHIWADNNHPCAAGNTYYGSQHVPTTPVAVATAVSVDPSSNVTFASVVYLGDAGVNLGAEVIPLALIAPAKGQPARYLKKKVLVGNVAAHSFDLPGGGSFDFGSAVNGQFRNVVSSTGFVIGN